MPEVEKKPEMVIEQLTVKLRRDQTVRLRMLREAMEEKVGRPYPMAELFEAAIDSFLDGIDDGK